MEPPPAVPAFDAYFNTVLDQFHRLASSQRGAITEAADWIAEAFDAGRFLFVFGSGHSHLLAEELFYRAGGLARVVPILDERLMLHQSATASTEWERREGYAAEVLQRYPLGEGDVLVVASNSGRNAVPIEMAQLARKAGAKVIGLVNMTQCKAWPSRHSSGQKLIDVVDLALDNCGVDGDAVLTLPGLPSRVGPTSTLTGTLLLNLLAVSVSDALIARGHPPEVFVSSNAGGDDHNLALLSRLRNANPHW